MRHAAAAALTTLAAALLPVPAATADPGAAVLHVVADIGCFGCGVYGPQGNSFSGSVTAGHGSFVTGATVAANQFTVTSPTGAFCQLSGTAAGSLTSGEQFSWRDGGRYWVVDGFGEGLATMRVLSPAGNPCGGPAQVEFVVTVAHGGQNVPEPPRGALVISRLPSTSPSPGPRLVSAPVTQHGTPWTCVDVVTGTAVASGSPLAGPDPGVTCSPPSGYLDVCERATVLVSGPVVASDSVDAASACGAVTASASAPGGPPAGVADGSSAPPWTCGTDETLAAPGAATYFVLCTANY